MHVKRGVVNGIVALALVAALVSGALLVTAQDVPPESGPAGLRFGIVGAGADTAAAAELGADWELLAFEWAALQAEPGADLRPDVLIAAALAAAANAGREVVGVITATPAWASESGRAVAVPDGLALPVDDPGNLWAQFVAALVTEYSAQGVQRWLIYDQPDVGPGEGRVSFAGSVEDYARMLVVAQDAARAVDPQTVIQPGALTWWADQFTGRTPYLERLIAALGAIAPEATFGPVTLRISDTTASLWEIVTATRVTLDAAGLETVPIWLLTNAGPSGDPQANPVSAVWTITLDQQADFMMQAAAVALALGVERLAVEQLVDAATVPPWGLLRTDGSRRPAFAAYRDTIALFREAAVALVFRNNWAVLVALQTPERDIYVAWARGDWAFELTVTAPEAGTWATLHRPAARTGIVRSEPVEWPAAYVIEVPAAARDAREFLTVAGTPQALVMDRRDDFFRVVYADINGQRLRVK